MLKECALPASDDRRSDNIASPPATAEAVAVALRQERETDDAPKVVGSGSGTGQAPISVGSRVLALS